MKTAIDPVCGMKADPESLPRAEHKGKTSWSGLGFGQQAGGEITLLR